MQIARDVLLGCVTWIASLSALIGTMVTCQWLWSPPGSDRGRVMVFMIGGAGLMISLLIIGSLAAAIIYNWRS